MKHTTNLANRTVLIKSLKKINKIKHKYNTSKKDKYKQAGWNSYREMDHLCGTVITLTTDCSTQDKRWHIYPWMVEAIVDCDKSKSSYPIYKLHKDLNAVVKFSSLTKGQCLLASDKFTYTLDEWIEHTDDCWVDLPYDPTVNLYHGQPIYIWCPCDSHKKEIRFYDAIHDCCFAHNGYLNGTELPNYEPIPTDHFTDWIIDAFKTLERE